jgi:superoxide dismutase
MSQKHLEHQTHNLPSTSNSQRSLHSASGFCGEPPSTSPFAVAAELSFPTFSDLAAAFSARARELGPNGGWVFLHVEPDGRIGVSSAVDVGCHGDGTLTTAKPIYAYDLHEHAYHLNHDEADDADVWAAPPPDEAEAHDARWEEHVGSWHKRVNWAVLNHVYAKMTGQE